MTELTGSESRKPGHKLLGLDHLRALAITIVFFFHYGRLFPHPEWVNAVSKFGWTGVDLFFVLSGFLISSQLFSSISQSKRISFNEFFLKRFFRIIPAYLAVVALYFLFPSFHEREALPPLWKFLTFTQNIGLDLSTQGTFSHAWSLCIEEQFYLLLPLTLILLVYYNAFKKGFMLLLLLFIIGFGTRLYCYNYLVLPKQDSADFYILWYKWIYYPTYSRLDGLLAGVSIAAVFNFLPNITNRIKKHGNKFLLASLLVLTGAYFLCLDAVTFSASIFGFPLVSLGYALMVMGAISSSSFLYNFKSKLTSTVAGLSFAIYLTHKITIHITQQQLVKLGIDKEGNLMFVICIATSLLGALLLNRVIEKPFLKLRDKILQPKMTSNELRLEKIPVKEF